MGHEWVEMTGLWLAGWLVGFGRDLYFLGGLLLLLLFVGDTETDPIPRGGKRSVH